jgi:hypothetical protein
MIAALLSGADHAEEPPGEVGRSRYVDIEKKFRGKVPLTIVRLSPLDRASLHNCKATMSGLLRNLTPFPDPDSRCRQLAYPAASDGVVSRIVSAGRVRKRRASSASGKTVGEANRVASCFRMRWRGPGYSGCPMPATGCGRPERALPRGGLRLAIDVDSLAGNLAGAGG